MNLRFRLVSVVLGGVYALLASFGVPAEDVPLRVLVPQSTSSIPLFEVAERDRSEDIVPGAAVTVEVFANHAQALARLLNGDVELLFTGSSVGWENHLGGGPVVMIDTGVWGVSSLVGGDDDFRGLADLKGKRVALPFPGAPLDLQMRYIFRKNGIDPDEDVDIIYAPFPQAAAQLLSGRIDAAPLPEPLATTLVSRHGLKRYVRLQDAWADVSGGDPYSPQVSLFCLGGTAATAAGTLADFVDAWRAASSFVGQHPDVAAADYADLLGQPETVAEEAIRNTIFLVPSLGENRTRVLQYIETVSTGSVRLPTDDFFFVP